MEFTLRNGQTLSFDPTPWMITKNPRCEIIGENEEEVTFLNANGIQGHISKELLQINQIPVKDGMIRLTEGLYNEYLVKPYKKESDRRVRALINAHMGQFIQHRELIYQKAEYFLLSGSPLYNSIAFMGGFVYGLGALLEAWEYNPAFHFDEFGGYEDMYLVSVSGIPLSGTQSTIFWCASKNKMIFFSSTSRQPLPGRLLDYIKLFQSEIIQRYPFQFDLNEMALDLLLREIGVPTD